MQLGQNYFWNCIEISNNCDIFAKIFFPLTEQSKDTIS